MIGGPGRSRRTILRAQDGDDGRSWSCGAGSARVARPAAAESGQSRSSESRHPMAPTRPAPALRRLAAPRLTQLTSPEPRPRPRGGRPVAAPQLARLGGLGQRAAGGHDSASSATPPGRRRPSRASRGVPGPAARGGVGRGCGSSGSVYSRRLRRRRESAHDARKWPRGLESSDCSGTALAVWQITCSNTKQHFLVSIIERLTHSIKRRRPPLAARQARAGSHARPRLLFATFR